MGLSLIVNYKYLIGVRQKYYGQGAAAVDTNIPY